jgi:hypothetical protein
VDTGAIMDGMGYVHVPNPSGVSDRRSAAVRSRCEPAGADAAPNLYDPSNYLSLDSIDFSIDPAKPALESVTFQLSSSLTWSIDSKVLIGGIAITLGGRQLLRQAETVRHADRHDRDRQSGQHLHARR